MYTLTVHKISLFPCLPIAFCEIALNFVWKACRQSTLRILSFTFCSMTQMFCTPAIDAYTHATCVCIRHMVYYHITYAWVASKSNSPLLASEQSTVELCIPASTCAHTNRTTCVRQRHFLWECTTNQIWRWQPSESPNIAKWRPPPSVQKIIAKNWTKIEKESASKYLNDLFW